MGLSDLFKKKNVAPQAEEETETTVIDEEYLNDITFIRDMKHICNGPWHQYDVVLAARGYGWNDMISWADYMADVDLENVSQVTFSNMGSGETDITESYKRNSDKCSQMPELTREQGVLSIAGVSKILKAPMKIVWFNQTQILRFFTFNNDETLMKKYVETVIRRTFGTENEMKLGQLIPESI